MVNNEQKILLTLPFNKGFNDEEISKLNGQSVNTFPEATLFFDPTFLESGPHINKDFKLKNYIRTYGESKKLF